MENSKKEGANFVKKLRHPFDELCPIDGIRHGERCPFVFKDLKKADHVFVRHDGPKAMLQLSYDGPFAVVTRDDKNFTICIYGKNITKQSWVKPAYLLSESLTDTGNIINSNARVQTRETEHWLRVQQKCTDF